MGHLVRFKTHRKLRQVVTHACSANNITNLFSLFSLMFLHPDCSLFASLYLSYHHRTVPTIPRGHT